MNKKFVVEKLMHAKIKLQGKKIKVKHHDSCHLEADPDGWACSCGAEDHANLVNPGMDEIISEIDAALDEVMR